MYIQTDGKLGVDMAGALTSGGSRTTLSLANSRPLVPGTITMAMLSSNGSSFRTLLFGSSQAQNTQFFNTIQNTTSPLLIGTNYLGDFYEILIFNQELSDPERETVQLYLSRKYNIFHNHNIFNSFF